MDGNYNNNNYCITKAMHGPGAWSTSCIIKENITWQINQGFDKHMTFNIYSMHCTS